MLCCSMACPNQALYGEKYCPECRAQINKITGQNLTALSEFNQRRKLEWERLDKIYRYLN